MRGSSNGSVHGRSRKPKTELSMSGFHRAGEKMRTLDTWYQRLLQHSA